MSRHHSGRRRREFAILNSRYVNKNYLKSLSLVFRDIKENYGVNQKELEFMMYFYEYEFFTSHWAASVLKRSQKKLYERTITPLRQQGLLEVVYNKSNADFLGTIFADETKNYRSRYAVSQKGRLIVQRVYRKLEGDDPIKLESRTSP
tara:strand:- start:307 stop:750 length:444 start_codon:yes stop_codon:yes gene_type:complete